MADKFDAEKCNQEAIVEAMFEGQLPPQKWSTGLCHCDNGDCGTGWLSFLCPVIKFGQNSSAIDGRDCCGPCCLASALLAIPKIGPFIMPLYTSRARSTLRNKYNIDTQCCSSKVCGIEVDDYFCHLCCMPCSLAQEHREMKLRGHWEMNPAIYSAPVQQDMVIGYAPLVMTAEV